MKGTMLYKKMLGGSSTWIKSTTNNHISTLYTFLAQHATAAGTKPRSFTYNALAQETGINRKQVQFACQKMAFLDPPLVQIKAGVMRSKGRCVERVKLVRVVARVSGNAQAHTQAQAEVQRK